jgi:hypothetical protein
LTSVERKQEVRWHWRVLWLVTSDKDHSPRGLSKASAEQILATRHIEFKTLRFVAWLNRSKRYYVVA